jgi:hypothetical protein
MREFITAAAAVEDEGDTFGSEITIKVDGREVAILPANEGALAMLLASDAVPLNEKVSASINFFFSILRDARDEDHFKQRLFDRKDPFGGAIIAELVEGIIEEWTGDPTQSSSDSTGSLDSTGESSTASAPRKASTRSGSRRTASAT